MTGSGRWQDDVLRELDALARQDASPAARQSLPVRRPDEERPHPGRPRPRTASQDPRAPAEDTSRSVGNTPAAQANQGSEQPSTEGARPAQPHSSTPAVRPPREAALPIRTPEPVPTLDPRLALALGAPQHGDSVARRTGRGLRKLTSSAAREVSEESRLAALLQQPVTTGRVIAVTSIRGGVGKTTTASLLARTLNHYRHDPVLALEADSALGTLPVRLGAESVRWSCGDLAQILTPSMQLTDVTGYLVPLADGGWLLPASQGRLSAPLDIPTYRTVTLALRRYFAVTVVDCETLPGEVARTAMDTAHARVVVAPLTAEGVNGTRIVLDWLGQLPHAALTSTVVALNTTSNEPTLELKAAMAHLRETGVTVVHLPYDRHLSGGGPIRTGLLGESTRRAATELAAEAMTRAVRVR
ncbi:type VII secretion protein [Streptomyces sp. NPDC052051]|uniref:nucleotide-binding protein n=1 Tax=Streptomyces sp. NPDC052051 TaxID=3154649 RepID=UPI003413B705